MIVLEDAADQINYRRTRLPTRLPNRASCGGYLLSLIRTKFESESDSQPTIKGYLYAVYATTYRTFPL